uniref:Uncharacterized protein n=1 Tax=Pinguiococcus pyrenoidosus TaxID=172671 RepID=A0A7R9U9P3_9STRA
MNTAAWGAPDLDDVAITEASASQAPSTTEARDENASMSGLGKAMQSLASDFIADVTKADETTEDVPKTEETNGAADEDQVAEGEANEATKEADSNVYAAVQDIVMDAAAPLVDAMSAATVEETSKEDEQAAGYAEDDAAATAPEASEPQNTAEADAVVPQEPMPELEQETEEAPGVPEAEAAEEAPAVAEASAEDASIPLDVEVPAVAENYFPQPEAETADDTQVDTDAQQEDEGLLRDGEVRHARVLVEAVEEDITGALQPDGVLGQMHTEAVSKMEAVAADAAAFGESWTGRGEGTGESVTDENSLGSFPIKGAKVPAFIATEGVAFEELQDNRKPFSPFSSSTEPEKPDEAARPRRRTEGDATLSLAVQNSSVLAQEAAEVLDVATPYEQLQDVLASSGSGTEAPSAALAYDNEKQTVEIEQLKTERTGLLEKLSGAADALGQLEELRKQVAELLTKNETLQGLLAKATGEVEQLRAEKEAYMNGGSSPAAEEHVATENEEAVANVAAEVSSAGAEVEKEVQKLTESEQEKDSRIKDLEGQVNNLGELLTDCRGIADRLVSNFDEDK